MPIGRWLAGELRPMMEDLLLDASCRQRGIFRPKAIQRMVRGHLSGQRDYGRHLWLLLNFELWYRTFLETRSPGRRSGGDPAQG
jgi:asparagine synthase (glutamine-hydrolysing)